MLFDPFSDIGPPRKSSSSKWPMSVNSVTMPSTKVKLVNDPPARAEWPLKV